MHSRVFTIVRNETEVKGVNFVSQDEVFDYMGESNADYVIESKYLKDDWDWLLTVNSDFMTGEKVGDYYTITIGLEKLEEHYEKRTKQFQELADKLTAKSWEYLSQDNLIYDLEHLINNRRGFWVVNGDEEYKSVNTFNTWLSVVYSTMLNSNIKELTFKVIQSFDYHC